MKIIRKYFSHPDCNRRLRNCTVSTALRQVVDFTTGEELHLAPKYSVLLLYSPATLLSTKICAERGVIFTLLRRIVKQMDQKNLPDNSKESFYKFFCHRNQRCRIRKKSECRCPQFPIRYALKLFLLFGRRHLL